MRTPKQGKRFFFEKKNQKIFNLFGASLPASPRQPQQKVLAAFQKSRPCLALAGLIALSSCGPDFDPLSREGLFQPTHVNRANLVAQVANPADLVRGTGSVTADGQLAAAAVDRLRTDRVKKLPASDLAAITASSSGSNDSGSSGSP